MYGISPDGHKEILKTFAEDFGHKELFLDILNFWKKQEFPFLDKI